jgi:tagatose 1,6-diphosphate aldolase
MSSMLKPIETDMTLSAGKRTRLERVSNSDGIIAALALDQRSALRSLLARANGVVPEEIPRRMLEEFKGEVSRVLTPHTSAVLLDPEYGLPAAGQRAKTSGLLLAYEQTGYDKGVAGRLPRLLDEWSVRRLVDAGADCVKVLLYYSPVSAKATNDVKHAWVERVGAECQALDVPFFLELVVYREEMDERSLEFARVKPQTVVASLGEFSKPQYSVDIFKIGLAVNMAFVGDSGDFAYTREQARSHLRRAGAATQKPFIYLSEGVSNKTFADALALAAEAGVRYSGVLCGRATWKDGVEIYAKGGKGALEEWLRSVGVENIRRVNEQLRAARSWQSVYPGKAAVDSGR